MRITLVTNAHISYNPRLLKEADALHDAGHRVRVVSVTNVPERVADDDRILATRAWCSTRLNFARHLPGGAFRWGISGIRTKIFSHLARLTFAAGLAERSFCRYFPETYRALVADPADLYIAHNLQALPIAAKAARKTGGLLGFDVEDFHLDEDSTLLADPFLQRLKARIMENHMHQCVYTSAPSGVMADALAGALSMNRPAVLYNVFPLGYRRGLLPPEDRPAGRAGQGTDSVFTAYWFSHIVSLDRGLQDFVRAMPLMDRRVDLHLRGGIHGDARDRLLKLAAESGVAERLHFHPPLHAEDLVRDAAHYDFGLALEQPVSRNRLITATNKIFTYLLAGIAVIATDTPGQREVMHQADGAGILYEPGDHHGLAAQVNAVFAQGRLAVMQQQAWESGGNRFNWDIEKTKFLSLVESLQ